MFAKCFANFSDRVNILLDHETIFNMQEKPWNFIYECLTKKLFFSGENLRNYLLCRRNVGNQFPAGSSASEPHTPNWRGQYCEFYFLVMQKGNYAEWIDKVTGLTRLKIIEACRMMIGWYDGKRPHGNLNFRFQTVCTQTCNGQSAKENFRKHYVCHISKNVEYIPKKNSLHALPNVVGNCVMEHLIASQEHFSWIIANLMRILALYLHILVYVSDLLMTMTKTKTDTFLNQNQYFPPKNFP